MFRRYPCAKDVLLRGQYPHLRVLLQMGVVLSDGFERKIAIMNEVLLN